MQNFFQSIKIVLIAPSHPGNIGASARAMYNMGLHALYLVAPKQFPHPAATERACAGGSKLLQNAVVCHSLQEAVSDCNWVVGSSARPRRFSVKARMPREIARDVVSHVQQGHGKAAIVFGRESSGLTNQEILHCQDILSIPMAAKNASLNLAAAVQLICYELLHTALEQSELAIPTTSSKVTPLAKQVQLDLFFDFLKDYMLNTEFLDPKQPRRLMTRLRRLCSRAKIDENELNIIWGILSSARPDLRDSFFKRIKNQLNQVD